MAIWRSGLDICTMQISIFTSLNMKILRRPNFTHPFIFNFDAIDSVAYFFIIINYFVGLNATNNMMNMIFFHIQRTKRHRPIRLHSGHSNFKWRTQVGLVQRKHIMTTFCMCVCFHYMWPVKLWSLLQMCSRPTCFFLTAGTRGNANWLNGSLCCLCYSSLMNISLILILWDVCFVSLSAVSRSLKYARNLHHIEH